jgi:hypothetical protein
VVVEPRLRQVTSPALKRRAGLPLYWWWVMFASALAKDPVFRPQEGSPHKNGTISKSGSLARPISAW